MRKISLALPLVVSILTVWAVLSLASSAAADLAPAPASPTELATTLPPPGLATPGLRLIESTSSRVVLELSTSDFRLEEDQSLGCLRLSVPGLASSSAPGQPELPVRGALVGIPAGGQITLEVLESDTIDLPVARELCTAPPSAHPQAPLNSQDPLGAMLLRDADIRTGGLGPASAQAELIGTGHVRSQRVAQVRFLPFLYDPQSGGLVFSSRIRIALSFALPAGASNPQSDFDEGPFERVLEHSLINYSQARTWRNPPAPSRKADHTEALSPTARIVISQTGLYQLDYDSLEMAGVPVGATGSDPRCWHLNGHGEEIAMWIEGESDGVFGATDLVLFYGQGIDTKYSDANVYWLSWEATPGLRMSEQWTEIGGDITVDQFTTTVHLEKNNIYQPAYPSGESDHWYWDYIYAIVNSDTNTYTFLIDALPSTGPNPVISGLLRSYAGNPFHMTEVLLNGHSVAEQVWDAGTDHHFAIATQHSYLVPGENELVLRGGGEPGQTVDAYWINWLAVKHGSGLVASEEQLAFSISQPGTVHIGGFLTSSVDILDVTEPDTPLVIMSKTIQGGSAGYTITFQQEPDGHRDYLAITPVSRLAPRLAELDLGSNLTGLEQGADYLIVSHGDFVTALQPLADHRAAQGLRTMIVDVQDVYDEFADGVLEPEALQRFLAHAYSYWQPPAPTYVLLVGDGHYDFRDYMGRGESLFMPPYLADVDPFMGETAADNRFVSLTEGDNLPDMHLGRLPVKTEDEAAAVVAKIISYDLNPPDADWTSRLLMVADNADSAGDFAARSDEIAQGFVPPPYTWTRVYIGQPPTFTAPAEAKIAIQQGINDGQLIVNYIGHSTIEYWATEQLLTKARIDQLTNADRLAFFVPMTCLEGYYIHPSPQGQDYSSLAEYAVRRPGGGAVASWSPTGLDVAAAHRYLNIGLYQALFFDDVITLGPATTLAKLHLIANEPGYGRLLDTYMLFGDPAQSLRVLDTDLEISKTSDRADATVLLDWITFTISYTNHGPATAHHIVISDVLPAGLISPTVIYTGAALSPAAPVDFVWHVDDLPAGQGGIITLSTRLSHQSAGRITNSVMIDTSSLDRDKSNNLSWVSFMSPHRLYLPIWMAEPQG